MKIVNPNRNYKVRATYGGKTTKTMVLTGQQIINKRKQNEKTLKSRKHKPYITLVVLKEVQ